MFNKKAVLKNFAIFTEKHLRWSLFLNKNVDLQSWKFIKKRLQRRFFSCEYCKIFKNTWFGQHLWTASNITRNMEIEKDIFSKTKQNKKKNIKNLAKWKKLNFHDALDHFVFLYISTACLRRRLPYIIKDDRSKGL